MSQGNSTKFDILELEALTANPFTPATTERYIASVNNALVYWDGSAWTTVGSVAGGSIPTFYAIFQNDQTLNLSSLPTFTIDRSSGNNDVLTLTNTGAGSGDVIQITNVGTGKDINGTSDTWSFTKAGVNVMKSTTVAGTAGSDSITLTAGDMVLSDGSITVTDADNAATFSVTNNTATTASVFVFAGSGTFTGSTTTSFMTITPSGLTTGTAVYLPVAALTTGKAVHIVGNALTQGNLIAVTSSATAITTTGRMFLSDHSGATGGSAVLNEFASAAGDETLILAVTATGALAAGAAFKVSASSMTTGSAILANDLDALTTGKGIHLASAATAITTTGRMFLSDHTGATGTSATLNEFKTAATDETILLALTTAGMVTGTALSIVGTTGMTSGSLLRLTSSTAGAVATNGVVSLRATGAFTSTSNVGFVDVLASATTAGTVMRLASTAAGQTATEVLRVVASGFTTGYTGNVAYFESSSTTGASNVIAVVAANSTAGNAVSITANSLTTGTGLLVTSSGTITSSGEGLVNIVGTGITTGSALKIDLTEGTLNGGKYINCYDDTATASVFSVGEDGVVLHSDFTEVVTGTNVITAAESGSVFFLNSATEFVSTLPAVRAGLHYTFIVTAAPSGASYTVVTDSSANVILGTVHASDGADADSELSGCDTINFVDGAAVVGDRVEVWCDGTNWFAIAHCNVSTGITFTTAS